MKDIGKILDGLNPRNPGPVDVSRDKISPPLVNIHNTCFVNVVLQALFHSKPLMRYILEGRYEPDIRNHIEDSRIMLIIQFIQMIKHVWITSSSGFPIRPLGFVSGLRDHLPLYEWGLQHDAQETLIWLLNTFHDCLSKQVIYKIEGEPINQLDRMRIEATLQWAKNYCKEEFSSDGDSSTWEKGQYKSNYSHILRIFAGQFLERVNCEGCNHINYKYESFLSSELTLPHISDQNSEAGRVLENSNDAEGLTIEDLLRNQCSLERLDVENEWTCDRCNVKNQPYRRMSYWQLPEILILSLKRFSYEKFRDNFYLRKIETLVQYDPVQVLDMEPFLSNSLSETKFYLYGIICHTGDLDSGHYYAYCKGIEGDWYMYNDEIVRPVTDLRRLITRDAYVLLYQRKDTL